MYARSSRPSRLEVAGGAHANPGKRWSNFCRCLEMTPPIVPQNDVLADIAVRDEQVEFSIAVEVCRYDGCRRFCRERFAVGKVALAVVEADVTRSGNLRAFARLAVHGVG